MPTVISTLKSSPEEIRRLEQKKAELGIPPAIEFWSKLKEHKDAAGNDVVSTKKDLYLSLDIPLRPGVKSKHGNYERHVKMFTGGTPEQYCLHRETVDEIITKLRYDQYKRKHAKDAEGRAKKDEEGNYIYVWEDCVLRVKNRD